MDRVVESGLLFRNDPPWSRLTNVSVQPVLRPEAGVARLAPERHAILVADEVRSCVMSIPCRQQHAIQSRNGSRFLVLVFPMDPAIFRTLLSQPVKSSRPVGLTCCR